MRIPEEPGIVPPGQGVGHGPQGRHSLGMREVNVGRCLRIVLAKPADGDIPAEGRLGEVLLSLHRHEPASLVVGGSSELDDALLFRVQPRHPCRVEFDTRQPILSQQRAQLGVTRIPGSEGHRQPRDHEVPGVGFEGGSARLIHVDDVHRASKKGKASGAGPKAPHESQATHPAAKSR